MNYVDVAEAIESLRQELSRAVAMGDGQYLRFHLEPIVLELQIVLTGEAGGKLGWKVIEFGGKVGGTASHTVTLTLTPEWWDGREYSTDFRVAAMLPPAPDGAGKVALPVEGPVRRSIDDGVEND